MSTVAIPLKSYVMAEFATPEACLAATRKIRADGYADLDTYSPYPMHGGSEALGLPKSKVPLIALCGGLSGAIGAYTLMWWTSAVSFPINVGNRLLHPWPAFIPITFECGVLATALSIFFGLMILSGLPQPYHPAHDLEEFRSSQTHAFWLQVGSVESAETRAKLETQLKELGATTVSTVTEEIP